MSFDPNDDVFAEKRGRPVQAAPHDAQNRHPWPSSMANGVGMVPHDTEAGRRPALSHTISRPILDDMGQAS